MLHINGITYRIGDRTLLEGATAALPEGARAGLIGANGAGKTTLLKIVLGEIAPENGGINMPRGARIGTVQQEAPEGPTSLIDHVLEADVERHALFAEAETATDPTRIAEIQMRLADIDAHGAPARAARILAGLGFDEPAQQRPLSEYSGGWRMRVALAAVLFSEPDLLLLDEPTNYLDLEGALWLEGYLASYPRTTLIVSHDREMLNASVDMIVHLDQGKLTVYRGGYDQFERQRREKQALQLKLKKKQDDQRRHLQEFVDRFRAKATKARQAQSRIKALEKLQPIATVIDTQTVPIVLNGPERPLSPPIVKMDEAVVGYDEKAVLRRLDLRIDEEDRIGLLGSNGNGKSTFAKLVSGRLQVMAGRMKRSSKLTVGYFAQHQLDEVNPQRTPYELFREKMPEATEAQVRARAGAAGFPSRKADTKASSLSGGEKARLLLALATHHKPHLLILDEPTNHLDIDARESLIQAINAYSGAVILISHDRHLLETCTDRLWLVDKGTVTPFDGDVDEYRRIVLESAGAARRKDKRKGSGKEGSGKGTGKDAKSTKVVTTKRKREEAGERAKLTPLRERVRAAEDRMSKFQAGIAKIDVALAAPDLFNRNPKRGAELSKLRSDAEKALVKAEEDWIEASSALEVAEGEVA
jgi:ATP-binding cassette subfamily F protein 3